jgi:hypothetical protein
MEEKSKVKCKDANLKLYAQLEKEHRYDDTRYYGVFISKTGDKKRIKIDVKRYGKKIGLSEKQLDIMKARRTHYYFPSKKQREDYNCNLIIPLIEDILNEWEKDYMPLIEKEIKAIKAKEYTPSDDDLFICGIIDHEEACTNALMRNIRAEAKAQEKKVKIYMSLYAQFFHQMVARIEAQTIKMLSNNGFSGDRFYRNNLYHFKGMTYERIKDLDGFKSYDKMYLIWHFIKHNSLSTYNEVNENYPEVLAKLKAGAKYKAGDMAYWYISFNNELITNILKGVSEFFKNYCKFVFKEDYDRAQWDYEEYFVARTNEEIETIRNPLGLSDY